MENTKRLVEVCECGQEVDNVGPSALSCCPDHGVVEGFTKFVPEEEL